MAGDFRFAHLEQALGQGDWKGIEWLSSSAWAYPALEVAHIVGIAVMLGSLLFVELRVWGYAAALPREVLARAGLKLTVGGFSLAGASGLLLFAAHPGEMLANGAFVLKMALLMLNGANAGLFHARGGIAKADATARVQTALSLLLWVCVIICGRWIAYL